jgi:hypothetical protein
LLLKARAAETDPAAFGAKVTVKEAVFPARIVNGNVTPLSENSELFRVAEEIFTAVPDAVNMAVNLFVLPTVTVPKGRVLGEMLKGPELAPTPESGITRLEVFAVTLIVPVAFPAIVGAKRALKVKLCPAVKLSGRLRPLRLNPLPEATAFEMLTVLFVGFVRVTAICVLLASATLPKATLDGDEVTSPCVPVP